MDVTLSYEDLREIVGREERTAAYARDLEGDISRLRAKLRVTRRALKSYRRAYRRAAFGDERATAVEEFRKAPQVREVHFAQLSTVFGEKAGVAIVDADGTVIVPAGYAGTFKVLVE